VSADRWSLCPRCRRNAGDLFDDEHDLREDWSIGLGPDGEFYVWYECRCRACGFGFTFERKELALST
jgi:hypothetical protein